MGEKGNLEQQIKGCAFGHCSLSSVPPVPLGLGTPRTLLYAPGFCTFLGFGLKPVFLQGQGKEVAHQRAVTDE